MFFDAKVEQLRQNPWNPNVVDPINQEKLENSLRSDGQTLPIIVRDTPDGYQILDGAHRFLAAKTLGWKELKARNLGTIDDEMAKKITLIANSRYGDNDPELFFELIKSMDSIEALMETLPIDDTEMSTLFSGGEVDFDDLTDDLETPEPTVSAEDLDTGASKAETHKILRFKLDIDTAEELSEKIAETIIAQGLSSEDRLNAAGDALIHLLEGRL